MAFRYCGDSYPQNHPRERRRWGLEWECGESQLRKRGRVSFQAVCVGKGCGQRSGKHGRLWKWRDGSRVGGFGEGTFFRKGPLPLCFLRLQSLSALECAVTLSVPLRFFKRGAVPVDGGNQIRHELHDFVHIAGAGDLFKARPDRPARADRRFRPDVRYGRRLGRPSARRPIVRPGWRAPKLHPVP